MEKEPRHTPPSEHSSLEESRISASSEHHRHPKRAGSRTLQALALIASLATNEPSADARGHHRRHARHNDDTSETQPAPKAEAKPAPKPLTRAQIRENEDTLKPRHGGMPVEIEAAKQLGYSNFKNRTDLVEALKNGELMSIDPDPEDGYTIDPGLGELAPEESRPLYRSLRPFAAESLKAMAANFYDKFKRKLIVSSAVRTEKYVDRLRQDNSNVASGYTSTHLLGTTIDVIYHAMENDKRPEFELTDEEKIWFENYLGVLERAGLIQATKEHKQLCYHIMFYPKKMEITIDTPAKE